jgi:hypothetical protein
MWWGSTSFWATALRGCSRTSSQASRTKPFIPVALYVWNVLYIALKQLGADVPELAPQDAMLHMTAWHDTILHVGFFGSFGGALGGVFIQALQQTAAQMAIHATAKNGFMQGLIPVLAKASKSTK